MKPSCLAWWILAALLFTSQESLGESHSLSQLAALHQQAAAAQNAGQYEEAERLHRAVVEGMAHIPEFPLNEQARQLSNLASVLNILGRPDEAIPLLSNALALLARQPSDDPAQYSTLHFNLGKAYALKQHWPSAESHYHEGIKVLTNSGVSDRLYLFEGDAGLGYVYWKTGRLAEAKAQYQAALEVARAIVPPSHPARRRWENEYRSVLKELRGQ